MTNTTTTYSRLFDIPDYQLAKYPSQKAFNYKEDGTWKSVDIQTFIDDIQIMSNALISIGIEPGDKISIVTHNNHYEWHVLDLALLQVGAISVPLYPTLSEKDFRYVLNHSESKYCFVSNNFLFKRISKVLPDTCVEHLFSFDAKISDNNYHSLYEIGKKHDCSEEVALRKSKIQEDDLATIIYTSGTTGQPKGALLSHKNIFFTSTKVIPSILDMPPSDGHRVVSYLPINHIFERITTYFYMFMGYEIYFAESVEKIATNFQEVKPHFIPVVPRLVEKIYDKIIAKGNELTGFKKKLFFWAVDLAGKYDINKPMPLGYRLKHKIADKLIFSKWRAVFGGEMKTMISGSAALQGRFVTIFKAAGIQICEGYGMTETCAVICVNDFRDNKVRVKSVGKPNEFIEVKIANDGEILIKGENVFLGYHNNPEKTAETIVDGYLHTGDIGIIDSDGFLTITDRKKQMFKTSGGKYIAPAIVENELKQSSFIEQVVVVGEGKVSPAAIIQINYEHVKEWARTNNINITDYATNLELIQKIKSEITKYSVDLSKWERIKKFKISPMEWTVEEGLLTPTLKAKRKVIIQKFQGLIDEIYAKA